MYYSHTAISLILAQIETKARNGYVLKTSYLQYRPIATQIMHRLVFFFTPNLNIPWRQEGLTSLPYRGQIMGVTGRLGNMHSKNDLNNYCSGGVDQQPTADGLKAVSSEHNSIGILAA